MSSEQQAAFNQSLTAELGCCRVTHGGVGVVALALYVLFDQVAQQIRAQGLTQGPGSAPGSKAKRIFGIGASSRIGRIIQTYLSLVPGVANSEEAMAETTELYDGWLKLELLDHYERMTMKKRMSTEAMQQWLTGAAFHLHMRIHQIRLNSVPLGSAESLRLSYKTGLKHLVKGYGAYLRRNILETAPGPLKPKPGSATGLKSSNTSVIRNVTGSESRLLNASLASPADEGYVSATPGVIVRDRSCKEGGSGEDFVLSQQKGGDNATEGEMSRVALNTSAGCVREEEEEGGGLGLLVIEPLRNVSHNVQHHPCESEAIQQALVTRILKAQDLEHNRNFFLYSPKVLRSLVRQRDDFELKTN
ncbi:uncharacterized protein LOC108238048 isoform X2 [Kryptolebias marmoratus]|nr:uncharacterized protein LOC108238048 isoform X2 [Kryptolebias marmoratus]